MTILIDIKKRKHNNGNNNSFNSDEAAYNKNMTVIASYGPLRTRRSWTVAILAAGMLVAMLLGQLFDYENLAITLGTLLPFNDLLASKIIAACLVVVELFSLPYLLGMYISPLMRVMSASFASIVSLFWLFTSLTNAHASNSGLFSTTVQVPGGLLPATWSLLLTGLIGYILYVDTRTRTTLEKKA